MNTILTEMRAEIEKLPDNDRLLLILTRAEEASRRKAHIVRLVQEALSELRLELKYLLFDLDCTRRERDEAQTR